MAARAELLSAETVRFGDQAFEGLQLGERLLAGKSFEDCEFTSCEMGELRLNRCRFSACTFRSCEMTLAEVGDSSFRDVTFEDCRMVGLNWDHAETTLGLGVTFVRCVLDGSSFAGLELEGLQMLECRAHGVDFSRARLTEAEIRGTSLRDARFDGADLRGADLAEAVDVRFDPRSVRTEGTRVSSEAASALLQALGVEIVTGPR